MQGFPEQKKVLRLHRVCGNKQFPGTEQGKKQGLQETIRVYLDFYLQIQQCKRKNGVCINQRKW